MGGDVVMGVGGRGLGGMSERWRRPLSCGEAAAFREGDLDQPKNSHGCHGRPGLRVELDNKSSLLTVRSPLRPLVSTGRPGGVRPSPEMIGGMVRILRGRRRYYGSDARGSG